MLYILEIFLIGIKDKIELFQAHGQTDVMG